MPIGSCAPSRQLKELTFTLAVLLVVACTAAGSDHHTRVPRAAPVGLSQINPGPSRLEMCKPGPWGSISYRYIYLEAPDETVEAFPVPDAKPRWNFPGWQNSEARGLFERARLPQSFIDAMFLPENHRTEGNVLEIDPPLADLESMTPEQRSTIYAELAKYEVNEFHKDPVFITSDDVDAWFRESTVPREIVNRFKRLCYRRGQTLVFSDVAALLSHASTPAEKKEVLKAVTRTRAISAQLQISETDNLKAISEYWAGGGRNSAILPMLGSFAEGRDASARLGLVHLLPSQPRQLVYTYPVPEMAEMGRMPDCHWTSLNFFNFSADASFLDSRKATAQVLNHYHKVDPPYQFGDFLAFIEKNGNALHSCVFVAGDIVYTKNGSNIATPWILMKLDDVKKIYLPETGGAVQGFREKDGSDQATGFAKKRRLTWKNVAMRRNPNRETSP